MTKYDIITRIHTPLLAYLNISPRADVNKLSVWKPGPVFQHTTKTLKRLVMGERDNTTKAFYISMSSAVLQHSALYGVPHREHARHYGLQNFDAHHRTDSRCPLDQPPGTTTKTDSLHLALRRRETHSGNQWTGSFLAAGYTPEWNTELESRPPMPAHWHQSPRRS